MGRNERPQDHAVKVILVVLGICAFAAGAWLIAVHGQTHGDPYGGQGTWNTRPLGFGVVGVGVLCFVGIRKT
jgi:hypothetical protein